MPRLSDPRFQPDCAIVVDGHRVPARTGESVTSALLAAGRALIGRSAKYHRPRGPFCLAASCASCMVRVDGTPNVRACETPCREGLRIETQNAVGGAAHDLLGVIDLLAPRGVDHHHLATWSQLANRVAVNASRQLAGLGQLPERAPGACAAVGEELFDALVVGSGPAGLGAAEALARADWRVIVVDQERAPGGRLRCRLELPGDPQPGWVDEVCCAVRRAGGEVATRSAAVGLWRRGDEVLTALSLRGRGGGARLVRAARAVVASGTWAQPPLFACNDLPGIHAARGLLVALAEDGVVAGERAAVLGAGAEADAVARRLGDAGMEVERIAGDVARARGGRRLAALDLADGRRVRCDVLAAATPRMPAAELAREVGARLELDAATGAFRVRPNEDGAVAPGVWAAGEVCGPCSALEAALAGRRAGEAAARG
jgi:sarcosine oxidase subunit alpha